MWPRSQLGYRPDSRTKRTKWWFRPSTSSGASCRGRGLRRVGVPITPKHFPRRIADDGVESGRGRGRGRTRRRRCRRTRAASGKSDARSRARVSGVSQRARFVRVERRVVLQQRVERGTHLRGRRRSARPEPARAPESAACASDGAAPRHRTAEPTSPPSRARRRSCRHGARRAARSGRVIRPIASSRPPAFESEQRQVGRVPAHVQAAQIVWRRADETVADAKAMIEKAEGLAAGERREPERQARELHRHGIGIDAGKTALGDQPSNVRVLATRRGRRPSIGPHRRARGRTPRRGAGTPRRETRRCPWPDRRRGARGSHLRPRR